MVNCCPDTVELCAVWSRAKLARVIEEQVLSNTCLTSLSARNRVFEPPEPGPAMLVWVLEFFTSPKACLTSLNLSGNEISVDGARALRNLLEESTSLRSLTVRECDLSAKALEDVAQGVMHNTHLQVLDISGNPAGVASVRTTSEMLKRNSCVRDVSLRSCFKQPTLSLMSMLKLIERPETRGDASRTTADNPTGPSAAAAGGTDAALPDGEAVAAEIGSALLVNTSLQSLDLRGNPLILAQGGGGDVFVEAMRRNATLHTLRLAHCELRETDAHALAGALAHNVCLTYLDISNNSIGSSGCEAMANMLRVNTCLQSLVMCSNKGIKAEGLIHIGNALAVNTCLQRIDLACIVFESAEAWGAFHLGVSQNTTLKTLQVESSTCVCALCVCVCALCVCVCVGGWV
jgi:hypothetical protein